MDCKLCGSKDIKIIYNNQIRNGGLGQYTNTNIKMYKCINCGVIWHDLIVQDLNEYYESEEYRISLEGTSEELEFYNKHDFETLAKFQYTGTQIYRNKIVADIGCGCGAFLDFLKGVAKRCIAIEPSQKYRSVLERKGYQVYAYMQGAKLEWKNKVELVTSFDVIEHVENPVEFMKDIYEILKENGEAIIGTPTDAPIMRELLGDIYERELLFSTQHLWIFSEKCLKKISEETGFRTIEIRYFQRYGLNNLIGWLLEKKPCSEIKNQDFITPTLDAVWKSECAQNGMSDYIVLYVKK